MRIVIGADHRGFELKQQLVSILSREDYEILDVGAGAYVKTDDYPVFAFRVGREVSMGAKEQENVVGILACGSGIGMSMAINKLPRLRAALIDSVEQAKQDRIEHDSNCLILEADEKTGKDYEQLVLAWLETKFAGGRHLRRVNQLKFQEKLLYLPYSFGKLVIPAIMEKEEEMFYRNLEKFYRETSTYPLLNIDIAEKKFVGADTVSAEVVIGKLHELERSHSEQLFSVHLMLENPKSVLEKLNGLKNVYLVYVHAEAELGNIFAQEWSFSLALVLNPDTEPSRAEKYFKHLYAVQLMTVSPGRQGRRFMPEVLLKSKELKNLGFSGEIHIDGGVNAETIPLILREGRIDLFNAGSALVGDEDPKGEFFNLLELVNAKN
ncbi:MAG: RpiB/LacA/LacB family sugar-phosphate isomerase [Candidatus Dojkabacteria bacterium]